MLVLCSQGPARGIFPDDVSTPAGSADAEADPETDAETNPEAHIRLELGGCSGPDSRVPEPERSPSDSAR